MSAVTPVVVVKGGREKSLRLRHPWLFSGAIERIDGHPGPGETVAITGADGESDGLPGVVADRYGNVVVLQLLSAGAELWRQAIADALAEATGARAVYERSDAEVRTLEGLTPRTGIVTGVLPRTITIFEGALCYTVD